MTKDQERQGEAAHSDVIKAQIQFNQQRAVLQDAQLQMENDRLTLAVLLFPTLTENFSVVDDLDQGQSLPPFSDARAMAARENPDLRVAMEAVRESSLGVSAARFAHASLHHHRFCLWYRGQRLRATQPGERCS